MIGMTEKTNMETPLEILSRAAQMVDTVNNARIIKTGVKKGRSGTVGCSLAKQQKRNSAPVVPLPREMDEPLDMSLKSRKRAASGDSVASSNNSDGDSSIKKHRPSVISYGKQERRGSVNFHAESQSGRGNIIRSLPVYNNFYGNRRPLPRLLISDEYSEQGIDEHFRRSLLKYMKNGDVELTMRRARESIDRQCQFDLKNFYKIVDENPVGK